MLPQSGPWIALVSGDIPFPNASRGVRNMRRTFWILAVGFILAIGVSSARADTSSTPSFVCTGSCDSIPTAVDVSFPSPIIQETWGNITDFIGLAAGDAATDTYTWSNSLMPGLGGPEVADYIMSITDVTTGDNGSALGTIGIGDIFFNGFQDNGTLNFSTSSGGTTPTPEPGTVGLLLAGIGALLVTRKSWA
jgi:hypothetical protein